MINNSSVKRWHTKLSAFVYLSHWWYIEIITIKLPYFAGKKCKKSIQDETKMCLWFSKQKIQTLIQRFRHGQKRGTDLIIISIETALGTGGGTSFGVS